MKKIYLTTLLAIFGLAAIAQVSVTFQVDMNGQTVSPNGVHVAGNFQAASGAPGDWDPATSAMTDDDDDGIYSLTVDIPAGQYEYKFINGNVWDDNETVPSINQVGGGNSNRAFAVTDWHADNGGFDIPAVMFGGTAPANKVAVRVEVDMAAVAEISAAGVHVAGNLLDPEWTPEYGTMFLSANSKYAYVASVDPDATYAYKFINGNEWGSDEWAGGAAPDECTTDGNRTVSVEGAAVSVETVCYEGCSTCAPLTEVTLRVNLSLEGGGNPDGVSVAGSFQGWSPGATLMTDMGDNIYEVTLMMEQGSYEYKFINGIAWGDDESVPAECNVGGNRGLEVGEDPVTVEVCFNQCTTECVEDPAPSDITFRVNMMNETVAPEGVWVMGNFTSPQWQDGAIQMTDADSDGIYEVTVTDIDGPAGIVYKFANGDPLATEEDGDFVAGGCGVDNGIGGFNRTLVRTGEPMVLDVVCYNSCEDCVVGLEESMLGQVSIFPNPSNGTTYVEIQNANKYTLTMSIVDITGKTVRENVILNSTINEVNTTNLNSGLYFLNIVNEHNDRSVYKLMVR